MENTTTDAALLKRKSEDVSDGDSKAHSAKAARTSETRDSSETRRKTSEMRVRKRNGDLQEVSFDKVLKRIQRLVEMDPPLRSANAWLIAQKVISGIKDGIETRDLDVLASEEAYYLTDLHPDYGWLASRIAVSNLHKETSQDWLVTARRMRAYVNKRTGIHSPLLSQDVFEAMERHADRITAVIDYSRDFQYDYFGFKTLMRSYLLKMDDRVAERPQQMLIRVAFGLHKDDVDRALETYDLMSRLEFTHASPTLFNAGTPFHQLSSCFLVSMSDDSIEGIYDTLKICAQISKSAGGIGLNVHNIRGTGSYIAGTNGYSNGLVPMLGVYNATARYVDQGGQKRPGANAIYLEPWHTDFMAFLQLRKNSGKEEERARDLFYAAWIPDLFMRRVESHGTWSFMCPHECPGLSDVWGEEFDRLYERYESEGRATKTFPAQDVWFAILDAQIEAGTPYMLFKDSANAKSNQQNLGTIKSSNLCVSGDTKVLTDRGQIPIRELVGKKVNVWNGSEWSETVPTQTGSDQNLLEVRLSDGAVLHCTEYHKFYVQPFYHAKKPVEVRAKDLKVGQKLVKFGLPKAFDIQPDAPFLHPYTHGFFCGDGTYRGGDPDVTIYSEKKRAVLPHLSLGEVSKQKDLASESLPLTLRLSSEIPRKFEVPLHQTIDTRLRWFEGLCDADGTIARCGTNETLQLASIRPEFLIEIRMMLQTLGIHSKVTKMRDEGTHMLPGSDREGPYVAYETKVLYRLLLTSVELQKLLDLGFAPKRLKIAKNPNIREAMRHVQVVSIGKGPEGVDTFCFSEPKKHYGVFNGVLTGNCTEVIEYSSPEEVAVCNLASVSLSKCMDRGSCTFDYRKLHRLVRVITRNLDRVIDVTKYPVPEAERSNKRHRPMGIGVQGLADVFIMLRIPFDSDEAAVINRDIFETIYHAALTESCELAKTNGTYETYQGSPVSKGILQQDMWPNRKPDSGLWDWGRLRADIREHGVRNSLLVAPMPTASTSQILGNTEAVEAINSNLYVRRVLAGEFMVVNRYLVEHLIELGLWNEAMLKRIVAERGSVQNIEEIPRNVREIYKTVWEIRQRAIVDMAADRAVYIDQSQSLNIHMAEPTYAKLTSLHFYAWRKGLKTGMYYLRTKPAANAIQFTVEQAEARKPLTESAMDVAILGSSSEGESVSSPGGSSVGSPGHEVGSEVVVVVSDSSSKSRKRRREEEEDTVSESVDNIRERAYGEVCTMKEGCISCTG